MIPQVQIPDFVGGFQRQQALAQQGEMSRLQALALQRAADSEARLNEALATAGPGLLSGDGPTYNSALAALARGGQQGLAMALPLIQRQRSRRESADFWGGGATPAPAVDVQPAPSGPAAPAGDAEAAARQAAAERAAIPLDAPDRAERIMEINNRLLGQYGPRGGSTSRTTATTVAAMPGWDDGIPAPGAVTRTPALPVSASGAPAGGRSGVSEAELRRIELGLAHPNAEIRQQAAARLQMLQFRLRENGQEPLVEIADPSSPTGRRLVTRAQGAGQPAPAPQDRDGPRPTWATQTILEVAPLVEAGRATAEQAERFRMAVDYYTRDQLNPATGQVTPGLPATPQMQRAMNALARAEGRPLPYPSPAIAPGNDAGPAPTAPAQPLGNNPLARPSVVEESASGSSRIIRPPQTTPQALEAYRKAEVETGKVNDAIRGFRDALRDAGGTGINAYLNNPRDPQATRLNTAFNNLVVALRAEPFLNTGVLQPGEIALIDRNLLNPQSLRGLLASRDGYDAMFNELEGFIGSGLARMRESAGLGAQIGQTGMTATPPPRTTGAQPTLLRFDSRGNRIE